MCCLIPRSLYPGVKFHSVCFAFLLLSSHQSFLSGEFWYLRPLSVELRVRFWWNLGILSHFCVLGLNGMSVKVTREKEEWGGGSPQSWASWTQLSRKDTGICVITTSAHSLHWQPDVEVTFAASLLSFILHLGEDIKNEQISKLITAVRDDHISKSNPLSLFETRNHGQIFTTFQSYICDGQLRWRPHGVCTFFCSNL